MTDQLPRLVKDCNPLGPSNKREDAIYEKGRDTILARLRNPDEAMVEAVGQAIFKESGWSRPLTREVLRALADVLATPPEASEE